MKNKKALFMIDIENDFLDGGKLGVTGSKEKFDKMPDFIEQKINDYVSIWASDDSHPITHCSFKENGGIWPVHCQEFTVGAALYQPIVEVFNKVGAYIHVFTKGTEEDREEYSVMRNAKSNKKIHALVESLGITEVDFCGIADIYCVKDSIEDFHREFPNIKINVLIDFIGFMDEKKFYEFLEKSDYIEVKKVI